MVYLNKVYGILMYHLVVTNIWKDPPFLRTVNHLFRLGPSKNHGYMLNSQGLIKTKTTMWGPRWIAELVNIFPISLWFMVRK